MGQAANPLLDDSNKFDHLVEVVRITPEVLNYMRIGERYHNVKFSTISPGLHKDAIRRLGNRIYTMCRGGWGVILCGSNGVGKTCAAILLLKRARSIGRSCLFIETSEYIKALLKNIMFDGNESLSDRALAVDLLVLDDFGKEGVKIDGGAWAGREIEDLLRIRNARLRSTIITTNWMPDHWASVFGKSMTSILTESMGIIEINGEDRRKGLE